MTRLEWRLAHPIRDGHRDRVEELGAELTDLEAERPSGIGPDDLRYEALGRELASLTIPPCEATGAPRVGDSPDWEMRLLVEFHDGEHLDDPLDFADYVELRREDYDCARCPYRTPYTSWPLDPCEFAAAPLLALVTDERTLEMAVSDLEPPEMAELAGLLDGLRHSALFTPAPEVDALDFLSKASLFLRFWAQLGFSVTAHSDEDAAEDGDDPDPVVDGDPTKIS